MKEMMVVGFVVFTLLLRLAVLYVLAPFVLMKVLAVFSISIGFFMCLLICWLVYLVAGLFRK